MTKAILEFNLPEEQNEFHTCVDGNKYRCVLWEFDNWLRGLIKYPESRPSKLDGETLSCVRAELLRCVEVEKLDIES